VPDWRDDEPSDDWAEPESRPGEGVRVVGPDGQPGRPPVPPQRAPGRFPLPEDSGSGWSAEPPPEPRRRGGRDPSSGSVQLPHWTDPPTGEVPRLGGSSSDDDYESWSSFTGPGTRFRTDSSDWNAGDFAHGELAHDDNTMIGALSDHDEHEEAWGPPRRRGGGRGRRGRPGPGPEGEGPGGSLEGAPAYEPVDSGDDRSPADLNRRVITGVVLAVVALAAFAAGRPVAAFLVTIIVGISAFELFDAFRRAGYHTAVPMGLLGCVAIVPIAYSQGERAFPLVAVLVITFSMLWYLFEVVHQRPTVNVGLTMLVFGYVGVLGGFAGLLLAPNPGGTGLLGGVVICAIGSDVVAYFAGRSFGNTPLMPRISPHKTLEGLIAGAIAAVVLGGLVGAVVHPWATKGVGAGLALGLVVAVTAPLGDLVESMLKRDLHVKDLGVILPGHGGFLDRFDAMLFALPAAYYLVLYLFSH
jgi:phosphatidate cytidylyltransferase